MTTNKTKYVLVERDGYHPTACSREVADDMERDVMFGSVLSRKPISLTEVRKQKIRIESDERHFELRQHFEWLDYVEQFTGQSVPLRILSVKKSGYTPEAVDVFGRLEIDGKSHTVLFTMLRAEEYPAGLPEMKRAEFESGSFLATGIKWYHGAGWLANGVQKQQ